MLVRYRNMLMYYKYDEFSMYKAMGFAAKNEENGNSFVYIQHKFARTAQACADAHQRTFALIQHLIHLQRIHTQKKTNEWHLMLTVSTDSPKTTTTTTTRKSNECMSTYRRAIDHRSLGFCYFFFGFYVAKSKLVVSFTRFVANMNHLKM